MADFSFDQSTIPRVAIRGTTLHAHYLIAPQVIEDNSVLKHLFANGFLVAKNFAAGNGALLSQDPSVAAELGSATYCSDHPDFRAFQNELFRPLTEEFGRWLAHYQAQRQTTATPELAAAQQTAQTVKGYQNVLRTGAQPLLNAKRQFIDFQSRILSAEEIQSGGWFIPLCEHDPIYKQHFGSMPLESYYAGIATARWVNRMDFKMGQIGAQPPLHIPQSSSVQGWREALRKIFRRET